jgi:hypothetical protein
MSTVAALKTALLAAISRNKEYTNFGQNGL